MGGRGASSGVSDSGKPYGSEYNTVYQSGNIKFVKQVNASNAKAPMETMTRGRVYANVNDKNEISSISYYDNSNKRTKQIDLTHDHQNMKPHTHHGYYHSEHDGKKGCYKLDCRGKENG
jgi:hypothetical protein